MKRKLSALVCGMLLSAPILAHDFTAGDIHIDHPWSRALPPVAPTGAAYMTITNNGKTTDTLISASTPRAEHTELHEHVHQDGLMKMQKIESVEIAPGETVEFVPSGNHVMLFELKQPLTDGDKYPMTLTFREAGEIEIEVVVTAKDSVHDAHADHGYHHEHDDNKQHSTHDDHSHH